MVSKLHAAVGRAMWLAACLLLAFPAFAQPEPSPCRAPNPASPWDTSRPDSVWDRSSEPSGIRLRGVWEAEGYWCNERTPKKQCISIEHIQESVVATKELGDDCIRSGQVTFKGEFTANPFGVQMHVTTGENRPTFWTPAVVTVENEDRFALTYQGGRMVFRRMKPAAASPARPEILDVVVVPDDAGWLPFHPLEPSILLLVYGRNLSDGKGPVALQTGASTSLAGVPHYFTLAEGVQGRDADIEPGLARRLPIARDNLVEFDVQRIQRAWRRGWERARVPAGPPAPGHELQGVLVRVALSGVPTPGTREFSIRDVRHSWMLPALPPRPQAHCPRLLQRSILEDFTYEREPWLPWLRVWDDVWGRQPLALVQSMRVDPLLSSAETPASRLERQFYDIPQLLGQDGAPPRSLAFACPSFDGVPEAKQQELNLALVGEYYWSRRRLRDGILVTLQHLIALDKLKTINCTASDAPGFARSTAAPVLGSVSCASLGAGAGIPRICERLKQECRGVEDFSAMVKNTEAAYLQWHLVERERIARDPRGSGGGAVTYGSPGSTEAMHALGESAARSVEAAARLERARDLIASVDPWISQPAFRGAASLEFASCAAPNADPARCRGLRTVSCRAIKAQAEALHARLLGHLDKFRQALNCLEGQGGCAMQTEELRKSVAMAPPLPPLPEGGADTPAAEYAHARLVYANASLRWAADRRAQRRYADAIDAELEEFYVTAALTVATMGIGELALLARGTAAAASSANAARSALTLARVMEAGAAGLDVGVSLQQLQRAVQQCSAVFGDTSPLTRTTFDTIRGPSCTAGSYAGPKVLRDHQQCVANAVLFELVGGLASTVPLGLKRWAELDVLARARARVTRPLDERMQNALTEFLSLRPRKGRDIPQIAGRLREAGFRPDEIERLLGEFVPDFRKLGVRRLGDAFVSGLEGEATLHRTVRMGGTEHRLAVDVVDGVAYVKRCSDCSRTLLNLVEDLLESKLVSPRSEAQLRDLLPRLRAFQAEYPMLTAPQREARLADLADVIVARGEANPELAALLEFTDALVPGRPIRYRYTDQDPVTGLAREREVHFQNFEQVMRKVLTEREGTFHFPLPRNRRDVRPPRLERVVQEVRKDNQGFDVVGLDRDGNLWIGESKYTDRVGRAVELNETRGRNGLQLDDQWRKDAVRKFVQDAGALTRLRQLYGDGHIFDLTRRFREDMNKARFAVIIPKHADDSVIRDQMRKVGLNPDTDLYTVDLQSRSE
jgi:hypothetical protein